MTLIEESNIRHAIYTGNGTELADAVKSAGHWLEYDELEKLVEDTPGGWHCVSYRGIEVGDVKIVDRYGRPEVRRD